MIPALLFVLSIVALVQFSVAFCRSLLLTYAKVELSNCVRDLTGLSSGRVHADEFARLMNLVHLAPDPGDDTMEIRSISIYRTLITLARALVSVVWQPGQVWCEGELQRCAYFAAVTLDRRLAPAAE